MTTDNRLLTVRHGKRDRRSPSRFTGRANVAAVRRDEIPRDRQRLYGIQGAIATAAKRHRHVGSRSAGVGNCRCIASSVAGYICMGNGYLQ